MLETRLLIDSVIFRANIKTTQFLKAEKDFLVQSGKQRMIIIFLFFFYINIPLQHKTALRFKSIFKC